MARSRHGDNLLGEATVQTVEFGYVSMRRFFSLAIAIAITLLFGGRNVVSAQQQAETADETEIAPVPDQTSAVIESGNGQEVSTDSEQQPDPGAEAFARVLDDESKNDLQQAITDCAEALNYDPENLLYLGTRAVLFGVTRQLDAARADAAKIIQLDPNNVPARILRSNSFELQGQADEALNELNESIQRNPGSIESYEARRDFYQRQNRRDDALADSDRIIQLSRSPAEGYISRAQVHEAFNEFDQAIEYASKALEYDPENWQGFYIRGLSHGKKLQFDEATKDLNQAQALAPDQSSIWAARALVYIENGEFEKGLGALRHGAVLDPEDYGIRGSLVELLATCPEAGLRNGKEAADLIKTVIADAPDQPQLWELRAVVAAENGDFDEAIRWETTYVHSNLISADDRKQGEMKLEVYEKHQPWRYPAKGVLSRIIAYETREPGAPTTPQQLRQDLETVANIMPDSWLHWNQLAWVLATCPDDNVRDARKAKEAADRAFSLEPKEPTIWDTRAAAFAEGGDFKNAVKWEQRFIDSAEILPKERDRGAARLALYRAHQTCREIPPLGGSATRASTPAQSPE